MATNLDPPKPGTNKSSLHRIHNMKSASKLSDSRKEELKIIYPGMNDLELLNIYRDLRNKLLRLSEYGNFICLVSAMEEEGNTSLLAMNLAAVFAFDRSRSALVIDCDTNWSLLDEICAQRDDIGLIDFIENDLDDISILIHESGIERLRIVPSGKVTDTRTEALESARMREIVFELKERYPDRYIIINAPSMRLSSEVKILSNISDMVVFELLASSVESTQVTAAIEMIGQDKIAGIVFKER